MVEMMMSDLPRVEYRKERLLPQDIEEMKQKTEQLQERVKKHGLGLGGMQLVSSNDYLKNK